jgi:hypothetical protein
MLLHLHMQARRLSAGVIQLILVRAELYESHLRRWRAPELFGPCAFVSLL